MRRDSQVEKKMGEITLTLPKPLTYQKDILNSFNNPDIKTIIFKKSRQVGGSYVAKMIIIKYLLENTNKKCMYITPTYRLSKSFYLTLEKSLKPFIKSSNSTDLLIQFKTGSTLQFFSGNNSSAESIRGFNSHLLIIDEASFIDDDTYYYSIKPSTLVLTEKIIVISTPNTSSGFFWELYNTALNGEQGFYFKEVSIYENPFVSPEDIHQIKKSIPERVFRQEYLGEFLDGDGAVFTNYKSCIVEEPKLTGTYYGAIDLAKQDDYTVLTIMNDLQQVVDIYRINQVDYTRQVKSLVMILNKWKPVKTICETNNIGDVVFELLKREYSGRLVPINLNNSLKKEMIENLVVAFEQEKIGIPDDDNLLRELQGFSIDYNPKTGNVYYSARNGLHDDMVISLAYVYSIAKRRDKNKTISIR